MGQREQSVRRWRRRSGEIELKWLQGGFLFVPITNSEKPGGATWPDWYAAQFPLRHCSPRQFPLRPYTSLDFGRPWGLLWGVFLRNRGVEDGVLLLCRLRRHGGRGGRGGSPRCGRRRGSPRPKRCAQLVERVVARLFEARIPLNRAETLHRIWGAVLPAKVFVGKPREVLRVHPPFVVQSEEHQSEL